MGYIWLGLLLLVELGFMIWSIVTRTTHQKEKELMTRLIFLSFCGGLTNLTSATTLGIMMVIALSIRPLLSKNKKRSKTIFTFIRNAITLSLSSHCTCLSFIFSP